MTGGLSYYGGKNPQRGIAHWITSMMPGPKDCSLYVEPFCGMLGVLLSRPEAFCEIINDQNDRVVNWWRVIRDHPDEFGRALDWTPQHSRSEYEISKGLLDDADPIKRAVAFTVIVTMGITHCDVREHMQYAVRYKKRYPPWCTDDILRLHRRIRRVQIENCDAVELLHRTAKQDHALIYCDPPYRTSDLRPYRFVPDWDALAGALQAQTGKVAISGYGDEWDHLGWHSVQRKSQVRTYNNSTQESTVRESTEKLWMNYDPPQEGLFR